MDYLLIGKIVNTHGIKGEVKILSDFLRKDLVFKKDFKLYVGRNLDEYIIDSYRHHKIFDMVCFQGINNINEVLNLKGSNVYVKRMDLDLKKDEYILEDLIDLNIIYNKEILGKVVDISYNNGNNLLKITGSKEFFIPINDVFIKKVDLKSKVIEVKNIEGLIIWK